MSVDVCRSPHTPKHPHTVRIGVVDVKGRLGLVDLHARHLFVLVLLQIRFVPTNGTVDLDANFFSTLTTVQVVQSVSVANTPSARIKSFTWSE